MKKVIVTILMLVSCVGLNAMDKKTDRYAGVLARLKSNTTNKLFDLVAKQDNESLNELDNLLERGSSPDETKDLLSLTDVAELVENDAALVILRKHQDKIEKKNLEPRRAPRWFEDSSSSDNENLSPDEKLSGESDHFKGW